ncbi:uncharacterized protein OCT59_003747 [Rhizophagus irregularis]|uniref:uncharacterized protein n=1 Tax=Rhizophagus irregularis TaxID=588596 RepID=UPI003326CCDD|nr:hypothetical protein OCT59_003747 [Rhizophagus irregularis]
MKNIVTAKVSYSNGNEYSIRNDPNYAPIFGGWDLYHDRNGVWCNSWCSSYPKIVGMPTGAFEMNDYEVFQVIRK